MRMTISCRYCIALKVLLLFLVVVVVVETSPSWLWISWPTWCWRTKDSWERSFSGRCSAYFSSLSFDGIYHFPPLHQSYSGKEQIILNRLLIDLTHSYLLNEEQSPNCDYCRSPLTVEHILSSRSAYRNIREKYYHHSQLILISLNQWC